jgi:tRNA splicing endonuclease
MVDNLKDKRLVKVLKEVDSAIYGGNFSEKTVDAVKLLTEIAQSLYVTEREKISLEKKNG